MANVTLEVDLSGIHDKLGERLDEMIERLDDLSPVLKPHAEFLEAEIQKSYDISQSPLGEGFAPLKPATIKRKGSSRPLIDTGLMRQASHAVGGKAGIKFGVSGEASTRARAHTIGAGALPRRSVFPIGGSGGVSFKSGRAKTWLERARDAVVNFILHGKVKK